MSCGPLTGQESFFYPPGSVEEHLVTEHGIDSLVVRRQAAGSYDHAGDHSKQTGVRTGAVGDLLAVGHAHEQAACDPKPRRPGPRERRWRARLLSVARADVAGPRPGNVDLRACRFAGAHNLDRPRIEGAPLLAQVPGWRRARRATVAEEQRWPAIYHPRPWDGWYPPVCRPTPSWAPCCRVAGLRCVQGRSGRPGGATSGKMSPIEIRQQW
jgi:hypothetical protein